MTKTADGTTYYADPTTAGLYYADPAHIGRQGLAHDVEELPELRSERKRLAADLAAAQRGEATGDDPDGIADQLADVDAEISILTQLA